MPQIRVGWFCCFLYLIVGQPLPSLLIRICSWVVLPSSLIINYKLVNCVYWVQVSLQGRSCPEVAELIIYESVYFLQGQYKNLFYWNSMNSVLNVLHLVTSCHEIQLSASFSTQRTKCFHCVDTNQQGCWSDWHFFVYIRTLKGWAIIHIPISQFSSFIRIAFYKVAVPFIFLGMSDQLVIDAVTWLLTSWIWVKSMIYWPCCCS